MSKIYEFTAKALDGTSIKLDRYKDRVLLIVNTASECGFTPQYAGLQKLHEKYSDKGLNVLGFPCNQFGNQEPGAESEIGTFCQKNYGVTFQIFAKIDVNGPKTHPMYAYLKQECPGILGSQDIKWNFSKFLVDRSGKVIKRYAPNVSPEDITSDIEKLLTHAALA